MRHGPAVAAGWATQTTGKRTQGDTGTVMETIEEANGLVSIGQLAKAAGVSSRTIRYYEELGILPEPRRTSGGTRKYPREYCGYIETALALKDLGFRLEEVKPLARLALGRAVSPGQRARAAQLVEDRIRALDRQVAVLRKLRDSVQPPDEVTGDLAVPQRQAET
jgi:DNA-binding transcriptional MerR regulator